MTARRSDRRAFLGTLGAVTLAAAFPHRLARGSARREALAKIGLQLYTVRGAMAQDFQGTLASVAQVGYTEVEFAGYFGRSPEVVKAALTGAGLTAPSVHVGFDMLGERWPETLANALVIGHKYIVVPSLPGELRRSADGYKRAAEAFNRAGQAARGVGIRFAYHNHDVEFAPVDGQIPYDILLATADPAVVEFEMDLYWVVKGGGDPLAYFARHPGRFPLVHVKDGGPPPERHMADVGSGVIDFRSIFAHHQQAGIEHYFVEHDQPQDQLASIRASYDYLKHLTF